MKYDQDMEEKENELAVLKQDYERELKELKETEEAYPQSPLPLLPYPRFFLHNFATITLFPSHIPE